MKENLVSMIMEAMKSKDETRLRVLRLIKTEFMKFETAKNAGELNEEAEINILKAMVKQRNQSIEEYNKAGRLDLVDSEKSEIDILETFLPQMVSEDELRGVISTLINQHNITDMKGMGIVMGSLKSTYGSSFDAGLVNKLFKQQIGL